MAAADACAERGGIAGPGRLSRRAVQLGLLLCFVFGISSAHASSRPRQGASFGLTAIMAGDVPQELNRDLERAGYLRLTRARWELALGVRTWYRGVIVGVYTAILYGASRFTTGPGGAHFLLAQRTSRLYGGYAIVDTQNLVVFPALNFGVQNTYAEMDSRAPPLFAAHYRGVHRRINLSQGSFLLGLSMGCDYQVPLFRRAGGYGGLIFGTRLGYAQGFPLAWYDADSNKKLDGGPGVSGSGVYARFLIGVGLPL